MTTEVVSAAMVPSRAAWRSLLWSAPLTALWVLLTYRWPAIPSSGIPTTTHQLAPAGLSRWDTLVPVLAEPTCHREISRT
jgi:hypothetical protein